VELAEAFRHLLQKHPRAKLFILGDEEAGDSVSEEVLSFLKSHPNVKLPGRVDPRPYLALADVFVLPTYREGFPNVVLEASAMGIPVVGTRATGVVDAVVDGVTGTLVSIGDSIELADAICDYLEHSPKRIEHGLAGRCRVVRDFQPESIWRAYYEDIVSLLRKRGLSVPESIPIEENQKIDLFHDEQITREWLAIREITLKGGETNLVCN
ncbi:MAG: glycosyltransferase, partial [Thermoguttaceae bacterium]